MKARMPLFRGRRSLRDLEKLSEAAISKHDINEKRKSVSIGVVDDQPFAPQEQLKDAGYRVTFLGNINEVAKVRGYQIVLCDLRGVATGLNPQGEGAFLISQIAKSHPDIFIVAYSGAGRTSNLVKDATSHSDAFVPKSAGPAEWHTVLDGLIDRASSPSVVWQRVRSRLVLDGIDAFDLAILEKEFIKSALAGDRKTFEKAVERSGLSSHMKPILQGLAASAIWALGALALG